MVNIGRIEHSQTVIINDYCQHRDTLHYDKATIIDVPYRAYWSSVETGAAARKGDR